MCRPQRNKGLPGRGAKPEGEALSLLRVRRRRLAEPPRENRRLTCPHPDARVGPLQALRERGFRTGHGVLPEEPAGVVTQPCIAERVRHPHNRCRREGSEAALNRVEVLLDECPDQRTRLRRRESIEEHGHEVLAPHRGCEGPLERALEERW